MKETVEFRINKDFYHLLFEENEGKSIGTSVKVVEISTNDSRYNEIPEIAKQVKETYDKGFFFGWKIKRKYQKSEINSALLFQFKIKNVFQPAGEEQGTLYDKTKACEICGANRGQISILKLKNSSIPKKDISKTIGGEVVVSQNFVECMQKWNVKGIEFKPILLGKDISKHYFQLVISNELNLSKKTIAGNDPFTSTLGSDGGVFNISGYDIKFDKEVYYCPKGHLIGLNVLSEAYVINNNILNEFDFFASKQKVGVKRGLLVPESIYFCSPRLREIIEQEKLTGFDFEVANIEMH